MSCFSEAPRLVILGNAGALCYVKRLAVSDKRRAWAEIGRGAAWLPRRTSRLSRTTEALRRSGPNSRTFTYRDIFICDKYTGIEWNWMCAFLEEVSATARGRTAAGDVDFCKIISPVHFASTKPLVKSLPRSEAIKWIWWNISNYKWTVFPCFGVP